MWRASNSAASWPDWCGNRLAVELVFVQAQASACGVTAAYANPLNLGADRWAALIGAQRWVPPTIASSTRAAP